MRGWMSADEVSERLAAESARVQAEIEQSAEALRAEVAGSSDSLRSELDASRQALRLELEGGRDAVRAEVGSLAHAPRRAARASSGRRRCCANGSRSARGASGRVSQPASAGRRGGPGGRGRGRRPARSAGRFPASRVEHPPGRPPIVSPPASRSSRACAPTMPSPRESPRPSSSHAWTISRSALRAQQRRRSMGSARSSLVWQLDGGTGRGWDRGAGGVARRAGACRVVGRLAARADRGVTRLRRQRGPARGGGRGRTAARRPAVATGRAGARDRARAAKGTCVPRRAPCRQRDGIPRGRYRTAPLDRASRCCGRRGGCTDGGPDSRVGGEGYVAFAPTAEGYRLVPVPGRPPELGAVVEVEGCEGPLVVTRYGRSPLPLDNRACAYLDRS